jgi:quercetin dioxygenase-like cupin family protein
MYNVTRALGRIGPVFCLLMTTTAAFAADKLLLVHRANLVETPATETLLGQRIWEMHETELSRTTLIELETDTPLMRHADGECTLIILEGNLDFTYDGETSRLVAGDFLSIPAGQPYRLASAGEGRTTLLGFDVPIIDMTMAEPSETVSLASAAVPTIKRQVEIMAGPTNWNDPSDRGWTLVKTSEKRANLVEMFSELKNHSHPDADHSLILLKGSARVVTPDEEKALEPGDYVSIPKSVAHKYYVDGTESALFISFDAPAYDPAKTVYLE